ncbi:MAG: type II toxin-antitoxin system RelE/ParE family toxin [Thermodesulfobacteriota bacterium]
MSYTVYFHPDAESEMNEAAQYLDHESPGLGTEFLRTIENAVDQIRCHPEAARLIQGRVRRKLVQKFPYSVIYSVRNTHIRILAVSHQKRRPYYWRSRR